MSVYPCVLYIINTTSKNAMYSIALFILQYLNYQNPCESVLFKALVKLILPKILILFQRSVTLSILILRSEIKRKKNKLIKAL